MDVFQYFRDDDAQIEEGLAQMIAHYSEWPQDHVFEESKRIFERIRKHFHEKEATLENNLKSTTGLESTLAELSREREAIDSQVNSLVMLHVDESGFDEYLASLLLMIKEHRKFCSQTYYPQIKAHLTKADLDHINDQLEQVVLK